MKKGVLLLVLGAMLSLGVAGCRWSQPPAYSVQSNRGQLETYDIVKSSLASSGYPVTEEHPDQFRITVTATAHRETPGRQSWIHLRVSPQGLVEMSATGFLTRDDGTMHSKLVSELDYVQGLINHGLSSAPAGASAPPAQPTAAVSTPALPASWTEPASDPQEWGPGKFTCLPVAIEAGTSDALKIRLSTGQLADVTVSIAYAPELCRATPQCPLPAGCPALGIGDSAKVQSLAAQLSAGQIGDTATLLSGETEIATVNLRDHGTIAEALR